MKIVVTMTGATGAIIGIRLLQALRAAPGVATDLIVSKWAGIARSIGLYPQEVRKRVLENWNE